MTSSGDQRGGPERKRARVRERRPKRVIIRRDSGGVCLILHSFGAEGLFRGGAQGSRMGRAGYRKHRYMNGLERSVQNWTRVRGRLRRSAIVMSDTPQCASEHLPAADAGGRAFEWRMNVGTIIGNRARWCEPREMGRARTEMGPRWSLSAFL